MDGAGNQGHQHVDTDQEEDQDDQIISEIPVFLSQTLANQLYIFQYPLSSSVKPLENPIIDCKFKPQNEQARIDVALDTDDDRYSNSKGEQIAINTDGSKNENNKNPYFKSGTMDKIRYESTQAVKDSSKYSVMVVQDNEVHITPVKGILQLRPSFNYFDKQDKRAKEEKEKENEDEIPVTEPEAKQVTVSFARNESEKLKKARESSFNFLQKKSMEEPWCDLMYYPFSSDKSELERTKLFACSTSAAATDSALNLPALDYLLSLVPPDEEALSTQGSSDVVNLKDLKKLPLIEECKILLKDAKLVTVGWAANILGVNGPPLLNALAASGRLLKGGRWAARSNLLYPSGSSSQHSGVPDNIMCRARDYVLYLFTQVQYVDRLKVTAAVKLPPEEVKEILSSVAQYQPNKGWELFIPPDLEFSSKYPDIEQRQTLYWDATQRQFNEMLTGEPMTPKRQRKKSQRDSVSSDSGMPSPKVRTNSMSYAQKENAVNSDNESGSDSKKVNMNNRKTPTITTCKRTKQQHGRTNSFSANDNNRVS